MTWKSIIICFFILLKVKGYTVVAHNHGLRTRIKETTKEKVISTLTGSCGRIRVHPQSKDRPGLPRTMPHPPIPPWSEFGVLNLDCIPALYLVSRSRDSCVLHVQHKWTYCDDKKVTLGCVLRARSDVRGVSDVERPRGLLIVFPSWLTLLTREKGLAAEYVLCVPLALALTSRPLA